MNPFLAEAERAAWGPGSLEMALPLVEATGIRPGMRVLEVGGGSGQVAAILARHRRVVVVVLEPWHGGEHIQERAAAAGVGERVLALKQRVEATPFARDTFDAVLSIGSFEMLEDARPEALDEMVRVTRPGGRVGIAEPMCQPAPIPPEVAALDDSLGAPFQRCFRTVAWNVELFRRHGLAAVTGRSFPEGYDWWRAYGAEGKVPAAEQELIRRDGGRWLGLGMVVGQKPHATAG